MSFKENNRLWHLTYHEEAAKTDDIELARALYEQRIRELEAHIAELEQSNIVEDTLILSENVLSLERSIEEIFKIL